VRARLTAPDRVECGAREFSTSISIVCNVPTGARVDGVDHDDQIRSVPLSQEIEWVAQRSTKCDSILGNRALSDELPTPRRGDTRSEPGHDDLAVLVSIMTFHREIQEVRGARNAGRDCEPLLHATAIPHVEGESFSTTRRRSSSMLS